MKLKELKKFDFNLVNNKFEGILTLRFWLKTKRKNRIYEQLFKESIYYGDCRHSKTLGVERALVKKLREMLIGLERCLQTDYLYPFDQMNWKPLKPRKLTKNTWVSAN